jgi:4-amino-4-deoxy-L-arabinose transferase-like glycosyltransferase
VRSAPDARRAWLAAAVVTLVLGGILAAELLRPRDFVTGTNNAGSSGPVHHVEPQQTLCVGDLRVPEGSGRVRLLLAPHPAMEVQAELAAGGRRSASPVTAAAAGGQPGSTSAGLDVPVPGDLDPAVPARLCVRPGGPIDVAGRPERFEGQAPPTLDGRPVPGVVAVFFLPPAGERRSLLAQLPDIARRAALFRPGLVGAWTFWLVLVVVPLAVGLAAVALVARAAAGGGLPRRAPLAVAAVAFATAACWSLLTPVLNAPDELEHVAYVQAIAEQGRAPHAGPSPLRAYSTEAQAAYEGARLPGEYRQVTGRPPWEPEAERRWAQLERRLGARGDDGAGWTTVADYTPAYYAAVAPAYLAAGGSSFWTKVTAVRLLTALLGALAAAFTVLLVRELVPRTAWPAVVAGLFVALQPMVSFMNGMVNNDAAAMALCSCALWLVVRGLRRGLTPRLALALGAVAVAAPMAKGNGLFVLPPLVLGAAGIWWRSRRGALPPLTRRTALHAAGGVVAALAVFVVLASALDHSADPTRPGWYAGTGNAFPTLPGKEVTPSQALREPGRFAQYLWQMALPPLPGMEDVRTGGVRAPAFQAYVQRGWGAFAFAVVMFPKWVYLLIAAVLAGLVALGLRLGLRRPAAVRRRGWETATLVAMVVCVLLGTELAYYSPGDPVIPEFGRYTFPAVAAFAALATGALFGAGRRPALVLGSGLVAAMAVLWWAGLWAMAGQLYT